MADARSKIMPACMGVALFAAAVLAINVRVLRGNLRAAQAALVQAESQARASHHEAAICRGMVGGQAAPTWQVRISTRL
jgi:hypothetical protein